MTFVAKIAERQEVVQTSCCIQKTSPHKIPRCVCVLLYVRRPLEWRSFTTGMCENVCECLMADAPFFVFPFELLFSRKNCEFPIHQLGLSQDCSD